MSENDNTNKYPDKHGTAGNKRRRADVIHKPKKPEAINRARQAKEDFENRMLEFKENIQSEPIKQMPGEPNWAFRERQKKEDDETAKNIKDRSLGSVIKQRARNESNKQIRKGKEYADRRIKSSPALSSAANKIKEAREKAEEFKKRRMEEIQKLAEKRKKVTDRINKIKALRNKLAKKIIKDKAKELAARLAKEIAAFTARIIVSAVSWLIASVGGTTLIVIIFVVIIIGYLASSCKDNTITDAFCSTISNVL